MLAAGGHSCDRVIVFGRYPEPGKTKTRLIPALGPAAAADFQRSLTKRTLKTLSRFPRDGRGEIEFCYEGESPHKVLRWIGRNIPCSRQSPGDLGERIYSAFGRTFKKGDRRVVLVGTDIPGLTRRPLPGFQSLQARENRPCARRRCDFRAKMAKGRDRSQFPHQCADRRVLCHGHLSRDDQEGLPRQARFSVRRIVARGSRAG